MEIFLRNELFKVVIWCMLGFGIVNLYNEVTNFTADEMTEIVQEIGNVSAETVDKGAVELLIDGLGGVTKTMFNFFIDIVNVATGRRDVGDGVDLLFGTFNDMTGIGFGSTFESFIDGFCNEMVSNLNKYFDKLISSLYLIF